MAKIDPEKVKGKFGGWSLKSAALRMRAQPKVHEMIERLAFEGVWPDGSPCSEGVRMKALAMMQSEVPEKVAERVVGVDAVEQKKEVRVHLVLDAKRDDPRVLEGEFSEMFGKVLPEPVKEG